MNIGRVFLLCCFQHFSRICFAVISQTKTCQWVLQSCNARQESYDLAEDRDKTLKDTIKFASPPEKTLTFNLSKRLLILQYLQGSSISDKQAGLSFLPRLMKIIRKRAGESQLHLNYLSNPRYRIWRVPQRALTFIKVQYWKPTSYPLFCTVKTIRNMYKAEQKFSWIYIGKGSPSIDLDFRQKKKKNLQQSGKEGYLETQGKSFELVYDDNIRATLCTSLSFTKIDIIF